MPVERGLHDAALDSSAAPVNEADFGESRGCSSVHVLGDDGRNVRGCERVEVELAFDRNANGLISHQPLATYSAVTTVLMPPRTEKSPTTVMRRG